MTSKKKAMALFAFTGFLGAVFIIHSRMPLVIQDRIEREATERGWSTQIGSVSWSVWKPFVIHVKDMDARKATRRVTASTATIEVDTSLKLQKITIRKGSVSLDGGRKTGKNVDEDGPELHGEDIDIQWKNPHDRCSGASLTRASFTVKKGKCTVSAVEASLRCGKVTVDADEIDADCAKKRVTVKTASSTWGDERAEWKNAEATVIKNGVRLEAREAGIRGLSINTVKADVRLFSSDPVKFETSVSVSSVTGRHRHIARNPVTVKDLRFEITYEGNLRKFSVSARPVRIGSVGVIVDVIRSDDVWKTEAILEPTPCQHLLDTIPDGMADDLREMKMGGEMSGRVRIEKGRDDVKVDASLKNECKVTSVPEKFLPPLRGRRFTRTVYRPDGSPYEAVGGAGSPGWTPFANISPYVVLSAITMEDPSFRSNHGFDISAIENSIRDNVKEGKFKRGASTISMQLAKNLWLGREKTISRKVREAFLTILLEQELHKDKIMELYLNSVEFGPNVYGIGRAAKHYFDTSPRNLTYAQSVFLVSILPKPNGYYFNADGTLHRGRRNYLGLIMDLMLRKGMVTDEEVSDGKAETVRRGGSVHRDVNTSGWDVNL